MPEFDVKHLLTSLRCFENVCNFKLIVFDGERFVAATLEIPIHITVRNSRIAKRHHL